MQHDVAGMASLAGQIRSLEPDSINRSRARRRVRHQLFGDPEPVQRLGRYTVGRVLGSGAMGVVYLAQDPHAGRQVAIKRLRPQPDVGGEHMRQRLRAEAQLLAGLAHPNIVTVFDIVDTPDSTGLVMRYIDGVPLDGWVAQTRPSVADIIGVLRIVADALAAAHDAGVIHRDLKPTNILVSKQANPFLVDFGLARATELGGDSQQSPGSPFGQLVSGTRPYVAPERWAGVPASAASDQYAFCALACELLCWPNRRETDQDAATLSPPGGSDRRLRRLLAILHRGLATDPQQRFASMGVLRDALVGRPVRASGLALAGAGIAMSVAAAVWASSDHDGCQDAAATLVAEHWTAALRDSAERAISEAVGDASLAPRVVRRIDARMDRWTWQYELACRAEATATVSCLEQDLQRVRTVMQTISEPGSNVAADAAALIAELPPPSDCRHTTARPSQAVPQSIRDALTRGWTLGNAEQHDEALTRGLAARDALEAYHPSREHAEALLVIGAARAGLEQHEAAADDLERAVWGALLVGDGGLGLEAARRRMTLALWVNELGVAERWHDVANSIVANYSPPVARRVRYTLSESYLAAKRGSLARALEVSEQAQQLAIAELDPHHPLMAVIERNLASYLMQLGDPELAIGHGERAVALTIRAHGPRTALELEIELNLGLALLLAGYPDEGLVMWHGVLEKAEGMAPVAQLSLGNANNNIGCYWADHGDRDRALPYLRRAETVFTDLFGADHPVPRATHKSLTHVLSGRVGCSPDSGVFSW